MPIAAAVTDADAILQVVCMRRIVGLGSIDAASHVRLKPTLDTMVVQGFIALDAQLVTYTPSAAGVKFLTAWQTHQKTPQRSNATDMTFLVAEITADTVSANVVGAIVGR